MYITYNIRMMIFIKSYITKSFSLNIDDTFSVKDIKNAIYEKEGTLIEYQLLVFNGNILKDEIIVKDINIKNEDILILDHIKS